MERLRKTTLIRLRDKLSDRGRRQTMAPVGALPAAALELLQVSTEYGPLCEAMYLIMASDGRVSSVEREVLKGAMRTLTDDSVSGTHIEALLDGATKKIAADGFDARLGKVIDTLKDDPVKSEVAYLLAASVAYADEDLDIRESKTLDRLAEGLGIDEEHANALMEELEGALE